MDCLKFHKRLIAITLISVTLAGCMVGPDYHSPDAPHVKSYTESPTPVKTVGIPEAGKTGKTQHFLSGRDIPAEWWYLFHSEALNNLICIGLANSPNLAAAKAVLTQAQENFNAQVGASLYPAVALQLTDSRQRFNTSSLGSTTNRLSSVFNLYGASVNVSYTLDVFGGARREIEALQAQIDYEYYELEAAYLTLTSNIVTTAVTMAALRAQIQATHDLIRSQESQLAIVKKQFRVGGASGADVFSQESQVAQTRATLPPLEQSLAQNSHILSVLIGIVPSAGCLPQFDLNKMSLPTRLPVSLPSLLVRQRPDIRAAEALLHVASAEVGVATANLYPQITLNGAFGWQNTSTGNFFSPNNELWNITAGLVQPIFNGGALRARKRSAVAAYQQAAEQYRQTVLQAFQNVADTLRALQNDAKALRAQMQAEIAARNSLVITEKQYRVGGVSYLSLLTAQRTYQQARISRIQAQAARYNDTAALFQAMGGGWWRKEHF